MPNEPRRPIDPSPRPSLFWRLFPSYLIVVAVGAVTTFLVADSFAPYFLDRHMHGMMRPMGGMGASGMTEGMLVDLEAAYLRALTSSLAWAAVTSLLAAAGVGWLMTRRVVAPLRAMTRASARIAGGTYHDRLDAAAPGEVGDLAEAFNTMAATLEQSEAQRVRLLADVSHEFRTPLSNLKGYLEGLEDGVFELDRPTLDACGRQLQRLERLVDDLSLLSRVETGQLALRPRPIAVADILEEARAAVRARFDRKGVRLAIEPPRLPLTVHADPERVAQVLANLLANALRYTPAGRRATLRARRVAADEVLFELEDEGPGMSAEILPHVFQRFFRGDGARGADGDSGSGIGLTLVKQLVERQGGRVGVDSTPGSGSRFWFTLPAEGSSDAAASSDDGAGDGAADGAGDRAG